MNDDSAKPTKKKESDSGSLQSKQVKLEFLEFFSGDIPPPTLLKQFDDVLPGTAQWILDRTKNEQDHQHNLDKLDRWLPFFLTLIGQSFAFLIAGGFVFGAVILLYNGRQIEGFSTLAASVITLTFRYVFGRQKDKKKD